jgi:hypothetical protein
VQEDVAAGAEAAGGTAAATQAVVIELLQRVERALENEALMRLVRCGRRRHAAAALLRRCALRIQGNPLPVGFPTNARSDAAPFTPPSPFSTQPDNAMRWDAGQATLARSLAALGRRVEEMDVRAALVELAAIVKALEIAVYRSSKRAADAGGSLTSSRCLACHQTVNADAAGRAPLSRSGGVLAPRALLDASSHGNQDTSAVALLRAPYPPELVETPSGSDDAPPGASLMASRRRLASASAHTTPRDGAGTPLRPRPPSGPHLPTQFLVLSRPQRQNGGSMSARSGDRRASPYLARA